MDNERDEAQEWYGHVLHYIPVQVVITIDGHDYQVD